MITKNRIKTVLTAMAILAIAATPALADLAAGVTLDFDASNPASGIDSSSWNSLTTVTDRNWTFGADVTLEAVSSSTTSSTKAYRFTGATGASAGSWDKFNENADTTWELWIKPADTGDDNQVIFETGGGGDGMALWYVKGTDSDNSGTFNFTIDDGTVQATVSAVIDTTDFHHIVAVYDKDADGLDLMQVYVDGVLVDDNDASTTFDDTTDTNTNGLNDWAGGDGATLGSNGGLADTVSGGQYEGDIAVLRFWEAKALTAAEVEENFKVLGVTDPMEPSPEDGEMVLPGDVELSWTNLDPVTPGGPVYVDVWFGTDPNDTTGVNFTKIVTADIDGENRTSVTVSAPLLEEPSPTPYYWQVTSYINGSPTSDPNAGRLYTFYAADLPPSSVDAGVDMITWSGQPVDLAATVEDDGVSPLTYAWSTDADGVVVEFSATDVQSPTVTITKVSYSEARITNAGFEDTQLADGDWDGAAGWMPVGGTSSGSWNPGATEGDTGYGGDAPEGDNVGWVGLGSGDAGGGLAQVLTETLTSDTTYELTVEVGNPANYDWPGYKVQFLAGGTVLAQDADTVVIANDTFETITVTHTSGGVSDPNVGQPLEIRLLVIGAPADNWAELDFDDVRLTADPPFPVLGGVQTVTMTLVVGDEANETAAEDTMTIDVYDDPCQMAVALDPAVIEMTDFNADCTTNLKDFAILALKWLGDYSLTEPVPLP